MKFSSIFAIVFITLFHSCGSKSKSESIQKKTSLAITQANSKIDNMDTDYSISSIKNYYPSEINKVDLNQKKEKEINRQNQLLELQKRTTKEQNELDSLLHKYGETIASIWEIDGGGCSWYCGGGNYNIKTSSSLKSKLVKAYDAKNANDLSYKTAWVEGSSGSGIGEFLEYYFKNISPRITKIIVSNGYMKSEEAWQNNNRVKQLQLYINGTSFGILNLEDSKTDQIFDIGTFGRNKNGTELIMKFVIRSIYKGDKYDDTAITEIYFDGIDVH